MHSCSQWRKTPPPHRHLVDRTCSFVCTMDSSEFGNTNATMETSEELKSRQKRVHFFLSRDLEPTPLLTPVQSTRSSAFAGRGETAPLQGQQWWARGVGELRGVWNAVCAVCALAKCDGCCVFVWLLVQAETNKKNFTSRLVRPLSSSLFKVFFRAPPYCHHKRSAAPPQTSGGGSLAREHGHLCERSRLCGFVRGGWSS